MSESCLYVRVFEAVRHVHFSYTDADAICGFICISILCMDALAHAPVSICFPEKEKKHKRVCVCARVFTGCSFMQEECALITGCRRLCCVHLWIRLDGSAERYGRDLLCLVHELIKAWGLPYFFFQPLLIQHSQKSVCPEYDFINIPVTVPLISVTCFLFIGAVVARL